MTRKFSELRAKMTPEARAESAKVSAALRTEFPQHQRQRASMVVTTISSREFNQDTSRAKKAAQDGPVFITGQSPSCTRSDDVRRLPAPHRQSLRVADAGRFADHTGCRRYRF
jgi:hypothetical protein